MNRFAKIAKEGAERLQGIDEGLGKEDIKDLKDEYNKKQRIDYRFNHYGVKPIYNARKVHLSSLKTDTHMGVDLFPEKRDDLKDERNTKAIKSIKKIEDVSGDS